MKKTLFLLTFCFGLSAMGAATAAHKVETIQNMFQETCKMKVSYQSALAMVRPLYLSCVPGTKVSVDKSCELRCLKASGTKLVGG